MPIKHYSRQPNAGGSKGKGIVMEYLFYMWLRAAVRPSGLQAGTILAVAHKIAIRK